MMASHWQLVMLRYGKSPSFPPPTLDFLLEYFPICLSPCLPTSLLACYLCVIWIGLWILPVVYHLT